MLKKRFKKLTKSLSLGLILVLSLFFGLSPAGVGQASEISVDVQPILLLEKINVEDAVAGSEFTLSLVVRNLTNHPAYNATLDFEVKGNDEDDKLAPFALKNGKNPTLDKIEGNESKTVMVPFTVAEDARNKDYEILINLTAKDATHKKTVRASAGINVPVIYDLTKPVLQVKEVSLNPAKPDVVEGFEAIFRIVNLSKTTEARNVMITLEGEDNFAVTEISNRKNMISIAKGEEKTISYRLKAKDTRNDNTVKLKMSFDYQANQKEEVEETINLPIPDEGMEMGATPRVIINKYTLSAEKVLAGNTVTMHLFIENTHQRPVKNVKISLGVIKIEDSSDGTVTTGGTVFSPLNSSNSFFIDSIPGKTIYQKDIDLYVDPNAAAKTYIVPVEIVYEDRAGKEFTCEEQINIPVTQECKLQIISTQVPPAGAVGEAVPVSAEFVNVGKVALGNFLVTLEGDFTTDNSTYYVGNLEIGASDYYQGMLIPQQEGPLEGKIVFSYIDNNNKEVRVEEPFTIEITAQPAIPKGMGPGMEGPEGMPLDGKPGGGGILGFLKTKGLTILLVLVILGEAIYIMRSRRKKASGELFDEEI